MKTAPKVLFLARWYPDRYDPMTGLFIKRHAEVATRIANVAVLYLRAAPEKSYSYQIEQYRENEVVTTLVYYGTKNPLPSFLSKLLSGFMFVVSFAKGYKFISESWGKPDVIHLNVLTRLGVFALWKRIFRNIPYVITEHWSRYLPITGTYHGILRKFITKIVVRYSSAVSTVSVNLSAAMQSHGLTNKNYMVMPNVVDTDAYNINNQETKSNIKRFVHISCFEDRSKNISGILRTISKLSKIRQDFECIMVGEGIDLDKMKSLAEDLQLKENTIKFMGLLENEDLIKEYQQADFMVMFSNYENMPVVISESFACGLPIIATSVGGIPEYVNIENGRLIAARDKTALLEAICYMLDHSSDFDKNIIRQQAVETFGKQAVAEKLEQLYSVALKRKG